MLSFLKSLIKTEHGLAVLFSAFILAITLISQSWNDFVLISNQTIQSIPTHTQLASAEGADTLTQGLVGWWKFDEGSGTTVTDFSGNNNNGTLVNSPTWTTDSKVGGGAMSFDGVDDYVKINNNSIGAGTVTFSAWIYVNSFIGLNRLISNGKFQLRVQNVANGRLYFSSNNETNAAVSGSGSISLNTWTFVTVTRDANGVANLFINGVLSGLPNQNSGTPLASAHSVYIGSATDGSGIFDGLIDDIRIYSRILSISEISNLYNFNGGNTSSTFLLPQQPINQPQVTSVESNQTIILPTTVNSEPQSPLPQSPLQTNQTSSQVGDYYDWNNRVDRYGKPAGIFDITPFPITEITTEYSIKNDENPQGKTYYLGTKYYVDGLKLDDSDDGLTLSTAKKTIKAAMTVAGNGNKTIIVRGAHDSFDGIYYWTIGDYSGYGVDDTHRWTLSGYKQERPVIDMGNLNRNVILSSRQVNAFATLQRIKIQNSGYNCIYVGGNPRRDAYYNLIDVWVYNCVSNIGNADSNIYFYNIQHGWIFHVTSEHTSGHCYKIGDTIGGSDNTVEWSVANGCGWYPGWTGPTSFWGSHPAGFDFPVDYGNQASNYTVRYNISKDSLFYGAGGRRTINWDMHHNEFFNNVRFDTICQGDAACISTFVNNSGGKAQLIFGYSNTTGKIHDNIIRDAASAGTAAISTLAISGGEFDIYNNLIYGNDNGILLDTGSAGIINILNNSIYVNSTGHGLYNLASNATVITKNNIIYQAGTGYAFRGYGTHENNIYYAPNGTAVKPTGLGAGDKIVNPLWLTIPSGIYSSNNAALVGNSPAVNGGADLSQYFSQDLNYTVRPQGSAWDIGAYEYVSGGAPASINGSCSATLNQCTSGTFSDITDTPTQHLWSCLGSNGGTAACSLPIATAPTIGDFNNDGLVNSIDLSLMTTVWNTNNITYDLNRDGRVNSLDYVSMVRNWTM